MEVILVCGALLSVLVASLLQYYLSTTRKAHLLPPGGSGWPLIGESVEFIRDMQNLQLEKFFFKRMARYSPSVFKTSIIGDHFAVLGDVHGRRLLFANSSKLVVRKLTRQVSRVLFTGEFEVKFDTYTKPGLLAFIKAEGLNNSVGVMNTMAQSHVQSWQSEAITMYPLVKKFLFSLACRLFLSIEDPAMVEKLFHPMEVLTVGLLSIPINLPGTRMNRAIKAAAELKRMIRSIVKEQRSAMEPTNSSGSSQINLLSYLMKEHDDDDIVVEGILGLIIGGYETSSSVICMTFKVLSDYPSVYRRVYQENMEVSAMKMPGELLSREDTQKMRYTWNVIREVMRLYPPVPFVSRDAIVDFTFAGFHIPKGHKLMASTYASHKDANNFEHPEKFDPSRFDGDGPLPYTYFPFGGGSFVCPGRTYAQLAMLVFVHNVVKTYTWDCMIPDEKIVGIPHPKPAKGLPLRLYPY